MAATSPLSLWSTLGEVFSLGYTSLIVYFMACFTFQNLLEADAISIEEFASVFALLVVSLSLWCYKQATGSKIHQEQLHAPNVDEGKSFTKVCAARLRALADLLSLFGSRHLDHSCTQTTPVAHVPSTTQQATKDEDKQQPCTLDLPRQVTEDEEQQQPCTLDAQEQTNKDEDQHQPCTLDAPEQTNTDEDQHQPCTLDAPEQTNTDEDQHQLYTLDAPEQTNKDEDQHQPCTLELPRQITEGEAQQQLYTLDALQQTTNYEDQHQPCTLDPSTCVSNHQHSQISVWQKQQSEFDVTQPALVDICSLASFTTIPQIEIQSESMFLTKALRDSLNFADTLPAYVTLQQSCMYGPQSPIDKIPSSPLQQDEKELPRSEASTRDIQEIRRFGPQPPDDKIPSLPLQHEEKILPGTEAIHCRHPRAFTKVPQVKGLRLANRTRAPVL